MRHNRRAVMAERYKLYMKKNFFNGRYFVRNMQIVICVLISAVVLFGTIYLIGSNNDTKDTAENEKVISVKEALFGNNDVTEAQITASVEEEAVVTEAVTEEVAEEAVVAENTETVEVMSEITDAVDEKSTENVSDSTGIEGIVESAVASYGDAIAENAVEETEEKEEGEFANRCIAHVDETLNVRKDPSRDAEFVGMMSQGSIATVEGTEGEWTKIKSGDVEGYVLSEFVLTGKIAEEYSKQYVTLQGKALEDGINIREERSTDAVILKVLDKDDTVSVVEDSEENTSEDKEDVASEEDTADDQTENAESTATDETEADKKVEKKDDINWLTVMLEDGQIGYVSAEYIEVEKLYTLAVSAEELQRREEERLAAERAAAEAALQAARQTAEAGSQTSSDGSTSYQGAKTTPVTAASSGECLGSFTITAYCGCNKCSGGHSKTASGTTPTQGRTIAADTSILPFGTQVVIDGVVYTVEDRGSGVVGNHIDIFFATHEDAMAFGSKTLKVYKY